MAEKRFKLSARVDSDNPSAVRPVLERLVASGKGTIQEDGDSLVVDAELQGEEAKELNRTLLSEMRRAEKKTRLRAEWTAEGVTARFFDYVPKGVRPSDKDL